MKIYFHRRILSTSASALLRANSCKETFAIASFKQTRGRGRLGSQWESPEGGIYLSIVLPFLTNDPNLYATHSVFAASIVSKWLEQTFCFKPTLKWPNDLWWQGSKIGGILCEGLKDNRVSIGIGLNLRTQNLSTVKNNQTYFVDCIAHKEVSTTHQDIQFYSKSLATFVYKNWHRVVFENLTSDYDKSKHVALWQNSTREVLFSQGLDSTGRLILSDDKRNRFLEGSVRNEFSPIGVEDRRLVWIDIGHTNTKAQTFGGKVFRFSNADLNENFFAPVLSEVVDPIVVIMSVNEKVRLGICEVFYALGIPVHNLVKKTSRLLTTYSLAGLGIDRLAHMEAVLETLVKDRATDLALVVSCGSANVVDVVRRSGEHLGGWILPGLELSTRTLFHMMDKPYSRTLLEITPPFTVGGSTEHCINAGLKNSFVYAVLQLREQTLQNGSGKNCKVFITGGNARYYSFPYTTASWAFLDRQLSFKGMKLLFN